MSKGSDIFLKQVYALRGYRKVIFLIYRDLDRNNHTMFLSRTNTGLLVIIPEKRFLVCLLMQ